MLSVKDIEQMTVYEFNVRMLSFRLSELDRQQELHMQAWLSQQVQATTGTGKRTKPMYQTFKEFFDYEEQLKIILNEKEEVEISDSKNDLVNLVMQANS